MLAVDEEMQFTQIVNSIVPKLKRKKVLTAGQYLLSFIAGRMCKPVQQKWNGGLVR
jgi:hypothetical protein